MSHFCISVFLIYLYIYIFLTLILSQPRKIFERSLSPYSLYVTRFDFSVAPLPYFCYYRSLAFLLTFSIPSCDPLSFSLYLLLALIGLLLLYIYLVGDNFTNNIHVAWKRMHARARSHDEPDQ
jgi:hypothetical protein